MDKIDKPPVIASASNSFSCDFLNSFFFDFPLPSDSSPSDASSSNTSSTVGTHGAQEYSTGTQATQISNQLACATSLSTLLPIRGTQAMSSTISTSLKPQTDKNRRIAPLPLRSAASASSIGVKPQEDQNHGTTPLPLRSTASTSSIAPSSVSLQPLSNENMPPPPAITRGKKRKSVLADKTATPSEPKKPRTARPLSEKQTQKQKALEVTSDNQVPSVPPRHDEYNNQSQDVIPNGVQPLPSSFPNHLLPNQLTVIPPQRALEGIAQLNESRAIRRPSTAVVNNAQDLQYLVSTCRLPGIIPVDINEQYPTRILEMMVAVQDPESQHILGAYFVPYLWFPEDPKRPYRVHKDDKYFWGRRIYEYHHRVQCGRIAFTITGSPVLFFKSEERKMIDSINYHIVVNFCRQMAGNTQSQVMQSLPGIAVDQEFGATTLVAASNVASSSQVEALHTEEQLTNIQNNSCGYSSTLTETAITRYQQSFFPSTSIMNSFADSQLNNNNEADININTSFDPTYNDSYIQSGPSTLAISKLASNTSHESQFNNHDNINTLSNDITQSFAELEDMYMNSNWFES